MIIDTMTWKEVADELGKDFVESHIRERWRTLEKANLRKYFSDFMHGKEPIMTPVMFQTKRNNRFYATSTIKKSEFSNSYKGNPSYAAPIFYRGRLWLCAMGWDEEKWICTFLSAHLFARYDERFNQKPVIDGKFIKRAILFFNSNFFTQGIERVNPKTGKKELFSVCKDGILLGEVIDGLMVYRTYIRFDMLQGDQIECYKDVLKDYNKMKEQKRW